MSALTEAELIQMMRDPRYWKDRDPQVVTAVREGFDRLYCGAPVPSGQDLKALGAIILKRHHKRDSAMHDYDMETERLEAEIRPAIFRAAFVHQPPECDRGLGEDLMFPFLHDCPFSPIETCVYDDQNDPAHDTCLFCGDPEERK
jgi:hypothetical protein